MGGAGGEDGLKHKGAKMGLLSLSAPWNGPKTRDSGQGMSIARQG